MNNSPLNLPLLPAEAQLVHESLNAAIANAGPQAGLVARRVLPVLERLEATVQRHAEQEDEQEVDQTGAKPPTPPAKKTPAKKAVNKKRPKASKEVKALSHQRHC